MKPFLICIGIVAVMSGILSWSADHDKKVEIASSRYEKCVKITLHMAPSAYYNEHGEYPTCK